MLSLVSLFIGNASAQEPMGKESSMVFNVDVGHLTSPYIRQNALQMSLAKKNNGLSFGLNATYAMDMGVSSVKGLPITLASIVDNRSSSETGSIDIDLSGLSLIGFAQFDWFTGINVRQRPVQFWAGGGLGVVQEKQYLLEVEQLRFQSRSLTPVIMPSVGGRVFFSENVSWELSVGVRYNLLELDTYSNSQVTILTTGLGLQF